MRSKASISSDKGNLCIKDENDGDSSPKVGGFGVSHEYFNIPADWT